MVGVGQASTADVTDETNELAYAVNVHTGAATEISFATFSYPLGVDVAPNGRCTDWRLLRRDGVQAQPVSGNISPLSHRRLPRPPSNALGVAPSGGFFGAGPAS